MAQQNIESQNPPIKWSDVDQAFQKINANFTELYLSIGGSGVDLSNIAADLIPDSDQIRDLGSSTRRWKDLYLSGSSLYLGSAAITSTGFAVNLPAGSTVDGALIRNPDEASFKTISVSGQSDVVADDYEGNVTFANGTGISITTSAGSDTVTVTNSGVTSLNAGTAMSVSSSTGSVTVNNAGVTSAVAGTGIGVSSATGAVTFTNDGVVQLTAGTGISVDPAGGTGTVQITNTLPNVPQNVYRFIAVSGQTTLDPPGTTSILNVINGGNIDITTNPGANTLTFAFNNQVDINGSVFADDSTLLVDGVDAKIVGNIETNSLVVNAGGFINLNSVDVLNGGTIEAQLLLVNTDVGAYGNIEILGGGSLIGKVTGDLTGSVFADDSSVMVNAVDNVLSANNVVTEQITATTTLSISAGGLTQIVTNDNIELDASLGVIYANSLTFEIDGTLMVSTIDTTDSSAITFVPAVTFNSDVVVENELYIGNSRVYPLDAIQAVIAESADFNDFKARIAAL